MKTLLVALLLAPLAAVALDDAPPAKLEAKPVTDAALVNVLATVRVLADEADVVPDRWVRVLSVPGPSGSAKAENCEVVHDLYVVVGEYGELPTRAMYRIAGLYEPKVEKIYALTGKPTVLISAGAKAKREGFRVALTLEGAEILPGGQKWSK